MRIHKSILGPFVYIFDCSTKLVVSDSVGPLAPKWAIICFAEKKIIFALLKFLIFF